MHPMLILHSICIVCIRATNTVLESTRIILLLLLYFVVGVSNVQLYATYYESTLVEYIQCYAKTCWYFLYA